MSREDRYILPDSRPKSLNIRGRIEMADESWETRATKFDKNVKKHLGNIKVLLIGPGFPKDQLEIRKDVAKKLKKDGCDIHIMESISGILRLMEFIMVLIFQGGATVRSVKLVYGG